MILTRKLQEKLIIQENITIQVLSVKGNQIRLGITAPKEIRIYREEIYARINANLSKNIL